tara:strand:+ start:587 stop:757 length:171 start_codon:yes stop_codon:yes gene_type:complete
MERKIKTKLTDRKLKYLKTYLSNIKSLNKNDLLIELYRVLKSNEGLAEYISRLKGN